MEKSTSLADFEALKRTIKGRPKTVANIVEQVRSTKDSSEITAIKKAAQIAAKALAKTVLYIKQGSALMPHVPITSRPIES